MASPECPEVNLAPIPLIKLSAIFGNSKNLKRDFGHRSVEVTKRYIGITQEEINLLEDKICI